MIKKDPINKGPKEVDFKIINGLLKFKNYFIFLFI